MITPAISVLSAVEGLERRHAGLRRRTSCRSPSSSWSGSSWSSSAAPARIGARLRPGDAASGSLTLGGARRARRSSGTPSVLARRQPAATRVDFFVAQRLHGFLVLGAVFLVVTGGEALYADMGHFGTRPDPLRLVRGRAAGAAAQLLRPGRAAPRATPRPRDEPVLSRWRRRWALYPLVVPRHGGDRHRLAGADLRRVLADACRRCSSATARASTIDAHVGGRQIGQIYIPAVNWVLMVACIGLVLGFRSSTNLAAAYGIAVTATMVITTILFYVVARERWGWRAGRGAALVRALPGHRPRLLRRQPRQDPARRLVPAGVAGARLHADDHLEEGRGACSPNACARRSSPFETFLQDIARRRPRACPAPPSS